MKGLLEIEQNSIVSITGSMFVTNHPERYLIWDKIQNIPHDILGALVDKDGIQRGVSPDLKKAFLVKENVIKELGLEKDKLKRVLTGGKQVKRYSIKHTDLWLIYTTRQDDFKSLPNICRHIDQFKSEITCKEVRDKKHPLYALHRPRKIGIFNKPEKLVGVITGDRLVLALDVDQTYVTDGLYVFGVKHHIDLKYIVGILNSKLLSFLYQLLTQEKGRVLAQVKPTVLSKLPIYRLDFSNSSDKSAHDRMVGLVDQMLELHKRLGEVKTPDSKRRIERQISATDRQIDALVYELYGLTEDEIRIVEGDAQ